MEDRESFIPGHLRKFYRTACATWAELLRAMRINNPKPSQLFCAAAFADKKIPCWMGYAEKNSAARRNGFLPRLPRQHLLDRSLKKLIFQEAGALALAQVLFYEQGFSP